eukprot:360578-Chlamydomonas_euryale.AAC.9
MAGAGSSVSMGQHEHKLLGWGRWKWAPQCYPAGTNSASCPTEKGQGDVSGCLDVWKCGGVLALAPEEQRS